MGDGLHDAGQRSPDPGQAEATVVATAPTSVETDRPAGGRSGKTKRWRRGGRPGSAVREPAPAAPAQPATAPRDLDRGDPLYAALDLGTNNCRLLIATPRERGFRVVDSFSRIVRLGEGISASGRLSEAAMERAVQALRICKSKLAARNVRRARLIATEACRLAENGAEFIARVLDETGLDLEVVSRETEARLAVAGCASLVDPSATGAILFDIGGGSSELVWLDLERRAGEPRRRLADRVRAWQSLPIGVVTLSERHGGEDVGHDTYEAMVAEVAAMLTGFPDIEALDAAAAAGGIHLLGTSGTVTTLAGVHLGLDRYDRRQVDGLWMTRAEVDDTIGKLRATDFAGRIANPCIGRERADLVLAGCAILEAVRRRWSCERLRVADRGLREGILVEMMTADGAWRRRGKGDGRRRPDEADTRPNG